jgi:hypothetical protein
MSSARGAFILANGWDAGIVYAMDHNPLNLRANNLTNIKSECQPKKKRRNRAR